MRGGQALPVEFIDVQLCLLTGWDYWKLKSVPPSFYQRLQIYFGAKGFVGRVEDEVEKQKHGRK